MTQDPPAPSATDPTHTWDPADYAAHASAQRVWALELMSRLNLRGDEVLLDVGCGDGATTAELAAAVPRGRVLGIDSSAEMIAHATRTHPATRFPHLTFSVMDARRIQLPAPVDAIFSNAALHWVDDHRAFLRGAASALKPGGRLAVSCGGRGNAADVFKSVRSVMRDPRWRAGFRGIARPYHFFGPEDYHRWLPEAGLEPRVVQLTPKEMSQPSRKAFAGWVRTTWLPYTNRVPMPLREDFVEAMINHFLNVHPPDSEGRVSVRMVRLEIVADKPLVSARACPYTPPHPGHD